jgi:prevent-host-death family protein
MVMKQISIQDLKARLSAAIAEAQSGATIIVTRHNEAVAQLGPARELHVHRGKAVGESGLKPAIKRGTGGRSLARLLEDRGNR